MKKPTIVHVLANGKKVKSIKGHVVPADNAVYKVILEVSKGAGNEKVC